MITYKKLAQIDYKSFLDFCIWLNVFIDNEKTKLENFVYGGYDYRGIYTSDIKNNIIKATRIMKRIKKYLKDDDRYYIDSSCCYNNTILSKNTGFLIGRFLECTR